MTDEEYFAHIRKIPWDPEFNYEETKGCAFLSFKNFYHFGNTPPIAVATAFHNALDYDMNENGLNKAVNTVAAMLFEIENNDVDEQVAYEAYLDCLDILTGDYDYLMNKEDCELFKKDIKIVMDYLDKHPELKEE